MVKFIKVPDGVIRADLIKRVTKYEYRNYEGSKYYGVRIEEETKHEYEEQQNRFSNSDYALEWRNEIYNNIVEQLSESERKEVEKDEFKGSN